MVRMEFELAILQLIMAIREDDDRVLTNIVFILCNSIVLEKEFSRAKYLDIFKHIREMRENLI